MTPEPINFYTSVKHRKKKHDLTENTLKDNIWFPDQLFCLPK